MVEHILRANGLHDGRRSARSPPGSFKADSGIKLLAPVVVASALAIFQKGTSLYNGSSFFLDANRTDRRLIHAAAVASLICCWIFSMTRRKKRILRGAAVSLYPLGIQLSIADVATTTSVDQQKTTVSGRPKVVRKMPRLFLPHDEIVDCVVTEIINIHTVRSAVVFRVARLQPSFPSEEPILKLIDAFPGVEMTYAECLQSRSLINVYLQGS